jgi:hypothetical protein
MQQSAGSLNLLDSSKNLDVYAGSPPSTRELKSRTEKEWLNNTSLLYLNRNRKMIVQKYHYFFY